MNVNTFRPTTTERPVATDPTNSAESVRDAHLANLGVRPVFDVVVVRSEEVVEAAVAGSLRPTNAPAVTHGLRRLDRLAALVEVVRG